MAVDNYLLCSGGTANSYWTNLLSNGGTGDPYGNTPARYETFPGSGVYRVYSAIATLGTAVNAATSDYSKAINIEVYDAYTDTSSQINFAAKWYSVTITSTILGTRTPAFHGGIQGAGYQHRINSTNSANIVITNANGMIDGLDAININPASTTQAAFRVSAIGGVIRYCIGQNGYGFQTANLGCSLYYNIAISCYTRGFSLYPSYAPDPGMVYNNTAIKCVTGFYALNGGQLCVNNVAYGCTTANWGTAPSYGYQNNNFGISTDTPWGTNPVTTLSSTDFNNYAANDVSPSGDTAFHTTSSLLVDSGVDTIEGMSANDCKGLYVPSWKNGSSTARDAGAIEFQWGYSADGRPPNYPVITISANTSLSGAEIRIYDMDNSPAGSLGTELLGIESHTSSAYIISTLNTGNLVWIQIMQTDYEEFGMEYTIPTTDTALPITLKADFNA